MLLDIRGVNNHDELDVNAGALEGAFGLFVG
jgi:hypothetical protein